MEAGTRVNQQQFGSSAIRWLVRCELPSLLVPYLITGGFMLVIGVLSAATVETGALGPEAEYGANSFFADFVLLLFATLLATTYISWGSLAEWRNPAERRLAMMRTLPIPISTVVRARILFLLLALVINGTAYFGVIYALGDIRLSPGAYLAFVSVWIGYALIWGGVTMYLDTVRGSKYILLSSFVSSTIAIGVIVVISLILGFQVVYTVGQLASDHSLLTAVSALVVGIAALIVTERLTVQDLPHREIPV
jgi:hypothetical protein